MIKILVVHGKNKSNTDIKNELIKKYPFLAKKYNDENMFSLSIRKLTSNAKLNLKRVQKLYFDADTVKAEDILPYLKKYPDANIVWFSFGDKKIKKTISITTINKLRKGS